MVATLVQLKLFNLCKFLFHFVDLQKKLSLI
jgi:hypothetical protein